MLSRGYTVLKDKQNSVSHKGKYILQNDYHVGANTFYKYIASWCTKIDKGECRYSFMPIVQQTYNWYCSSNSNVQKWLEVIQVDVKLHHDVLLRDIIWATVLYHLIQMVRMPTGARKHVSRRHQDSRWARDHTKLLRPYETSHELGSRSWSNLKVITGIFKPD